MWRRHRIRAARSGIAATPHRTPTGPKRLWVVCVRSQSVRPGGDGCHRGPANWAAYNASKHGLIGLTRTLAAEWGGRGVRVNAVCPGWVKTPMDDASQGEGAYGDQDITDHVPLGRFAKPDDVAQAVAFLADARRSAFVNGVTLSVDGGWAADGSWQSLRLGARNRT